jgi:hypothetical protein
MLAVLNDRPAVVEELLKNSKIDLGKTDSEGKTALNLAKQLGNKKIVAILEKPVETSTTDTTTDTSKVDTSTTSKLVCTPENKEKYKKAKEEYAALEKQKAELTKTIETLQAEYETSQSTATATKLIKLFRDQTKTLEKMTSLQSLITDMEVCGIHKQ